MKNSSHSPSTAYIKTSQPNTDLPVLNCAATHRRSTQAASDLSFTEDFDSHDRVFPSPPSPSYTKWSQGVSPRAAGKQHRNSLPTILPSNSASYSNSQAEHSPVRTSYSPTSVNFPLPVALQRLKEADLETFKLARACGMTPDPVRITRPHKLLFLAEEKEAMHNKDSRENDEIKEIAKHSRLEGSLEMRKHPRSYSPNSPRAESLAHVSHVSALQRSSPSPTEFQINNAQARKRPPPFAPAQNPHALLHRLAQLLRKYRSVWTLVSTSSGQLMPHDLINIDCLFHEHGIDWQVEEMRSEAERNVYGRSFQERLEEDKEKSTSWRKPMSLIDANEPGYHVFGQPLQLTRLYASRVCSMAGYQHDLPIVVYACVEELYRTGMTVPGLFRSPPDRTRHAELVELFDHGPTFGRSMTLAKESTADICALLRSVIDRMPRAVWHESLFDAMWRLCIMPSKNREKQITEDTERNDKTDNVGIQNRKEAKFLSPVIEYSHKIQSSLSKCKQSPAFSTSESLSNLSDTLVSSVSKAITDRDLEIEAPQIEAARILFRLLPRTQLALMAYLCAFFTQIPLSPQNQIGIEDISRLFAAPLFLGKPSGVPVTGLAWNSKKDKAREMMSWVLHRWAHISENLFDVSITPESAECDQDDNISSTDSESIYSLLSLGGWHESSSSFDEISQSTGRLDEGDLSASMINAKNGGRVVDSDSKLNSERSGAYDQIMRWKIVVEKDIDDLRKELGDVRAKLNKKI